MMSKTFYGNTVLQWIIAFSIITGAMILGKCLYWLIGKTVKKLASKTKTRLDDILVDMLEEPFVLAVIIGGTWYGIKFLTLSAMAATTVDKAFQGLIIVNAAWLLSRLFDALVEEYLIPFVKQTESDLDDQLVPVIRKSIKLSVWIIAIIMALDNAGYEVFSILAGLGIGGLAFALAAQETVGNFFGSIAIFTDKPFKVGDRIQVGGHYFVFTDAGPTRICTLSLYDALPISIRLSSGF
ncbi:MAG: mechanosensitive ion channel [Planctomycetes bacterium]|nr:mechanosensitive ion channel [Planctomycetota bacterium]